MKLFDKLLRFDELRVQLKASEEAGIELAKENADLRIENTLLRRSNEIVRCKDCKRYVPQGTHLFNGGVVNKDTCDVIRGFVVQINSDGFCAWGERLID